MALQSKQHRTTQDALMAVNQLVKLANHHGVQLLAVNVGEHIYPGDVYDAYAALNIPPSEDQADGVNGYGPVAAVLMHRYAELNDSNWSEGIRLFKPQYIRGFEDGFILIVPTAVDDNHDWDYLRGVYDGVMAHAAVF